MDNAVSPHLGISRRDLLRRGAVVGGTLVWAAPAVQTIARPAFGSTDGTPENGEAGKDFSYIALRYECGDGNTYAIKFDFNGVNQFECSTANNKGQLNTPQCSFDLTDVVQTPSSHCSKFAFSYPNNDLTAIRVTMLDGDDCIIVGVGVGKCGNPENPQSGGECVEVNAGPGGAMSLLFDLCGR